MFRLIGINVSTAFVLFCVVAFPIYLVTCEIKSLRIEVHDVGARCFPVPDAGSTDAGPDAP